MLSMNIYPGLQFSRNASEELGTNWANWKKVQTERFESIIMNNNDVGVSSYNDFGGKEKNLFLFVAAGSYMAQFRNPNMRDNGYITNKIPMLISPSVSALNSTNPSFMTFELTHENNKPLLFGYSKDYNN